ncbi:MAG: CPBP family intramembrane metalloprotease [Bacteroidales bacterium]|nr:CPBP family intramembrane metalloprotease [Bacteroidales bacterium]
MDFIRPFFEGKNRLVQILFLLLFVVAGTIVFSGLGMLVAYAVYHTNNMYKASDPAGYIRLVQAFNSVGMFLVPALMFAYAHDRKWLHYNWADRKPHYLLVNVTLVLSIVILPVVALLSQWNQAIELPKSLGSLQQWMADMDAKAEELTTLLTFKHTYGTLLANIFVLALIPAIGEEFMFQGTIQAFLNKWTQKPHLSVWITALIFSAIHFQFSGFIPRLLLGAYLGYLFYWSRSLWLPILAHFLHNALSLLVDFSFQGRGVSLDDIKFTDIHGAIPLAISCTVVTFVSLLFMWRTQKELHHNEERL